MNILILNGGPGDARGAACREVAGMVEGEARSKGWAVAAFDLAGLEIKPCRGCFACWLKHPGICVIKDDQEAVLRAAATGDLQVWITPVTFGGFGSVLKRSVDRLLPNILPFFVRIDGEVHHPQRYERWRRLLALGTLAGPDEGAERIFHGLARRNALNFGNAAVLSGIIYDGEERTAAAGRIRGLLEALGEER
jgi:multimeric flavodoxin WrbA